MMGEPAGWYRDPAPVHPSQPSTLRYWDGQGWTVQVKQASKHERREWQAEAVAQQRMWAAQQQQQAQTALHAGVSPVQAAPGSRDFTPDGERLAGWWARVAASWIDGALSGVLGVLFAWRFIKQLAEASMGALSASQDATATTTTNPAFDSYLHQFVTAYLGMVLVIVGVRMVYDVGFLKGFQATPGKMALGLEVRLRSQPGVLSWGTVLVRWLAQRAYAVLVVVPLVGPVVVLVWWLLDPLWPLWDGRRQALHDKVARTNVVSRRG